MKCVCWTLVATLTVPVWAEDDARNEARSIYELARQTEAKGDSLQAFFLYGRAASTDPSNAAYAMQQRALQGRLQRGAIGLPSSDPLVDPAATPEDRMATRIVVEQLTPSEVIEGDPARAPLRLKPSTDRRSFDLRGTPRALIEEVLKGFGIDTIFEQDFQAQGTTTFRVENISRDEALHALELIGNCFFVPVRDNAVMVYRDTQDKRNSNAPTMATVIPIPDRMNVQEAQELASGVQQILEIRHIAVDAGRRLIFIRDQEYKVLAARRLVADLMRLRAEVVVEVELISVASHSDLTYGMSLQNTFNIVALQAFNPVRLSLLPALSTGWFGLALQDAAAFANISRSSTQASLKSEMLALDGQQVQLHIGDRYPVITGLSGFGTSSVPTTQFQDLGLNLQLTPVVHDGDVTLTVDADYNVLAGGTNNGIPIISSRKFTGTVQIPYGKWAVIGSLKKLEDSTVVNGIAGLSDIPGVGHLFRKDSVIKDRSDIMLILKPHLVSEPGFRRPTTGVWMGTETKPPTFY